MANYSIIINSRFKPFSYAEMLAPVQLSTEAHQKLEEAYADLTTLADMVAAKASELTDPKAYARYKRYSELLQRQAEKLARYGLQPDSRGDVFAMKSRFSKDILPIAEAVQQRQKYADMQFQALLLNPTLLIGKRAATTSLDEFLDNPNIDFSQLYSGATLMSQVAQLAQSIAKELTSYGPGKPLDAYTNTFLKKFGFSREQVLNAINNPNDPSSSKVLTAIVDLALISSGIPQWGDKQILERARAYANQGLWSAVGQSDIGTFENFGAKQNLQYAHSVALENLKHKHNLAEKAYAARLAGANGGTGSGLASLPISTNPIEAANSDEYMKQLKKNSKFDRFFVKDASGRYVGLTPEGIKEYNKTTTFTKKKTGHGVDWAKTTGTEKVTVHSDFYNYINEINGGAYKKGAPVAYTEEMMNNSVFKNSTIARSITGSKAHIKDSEIAAIYDKEMKRLGEVGGTGNPYYDVLQIKATQTSFPQTKDFQEGLKNAIVASRFSNKEKLLEVEWDSKTHQYKHTGKYLDKDDILNDKTFIRGMERSGRGLIYKVDKGGKSKYYEVPKELNTTSHDNATGAYRRAEFYQRIFLGNENINFDDYADAFGYPGSAEYETAKYLVDKVKRGEPLTEYERKVLNREYTNEFLSAEQNADNLYWETKPKDNNTQPF